MDEELALDHACFIKTQLNMPRAYTGTEKSVLLIGAGELGESLLRQIQKTPDIVTVPEMHECMS